MTDKFVYEGMVRVFDRDEGDVISLVDLPGSPELTGAFEEWFGEGFLCCGPPVGPVRITVEKIS